MTPDEWHCLVNEVIPGYWPREKLPAARAEALRDRFGRHTFPDLAALVRRYAAENVDQERPGGKLWQWIAERVQPARSAGIEMDARERARMAHAERETRAAWDAMSDAERRETVQQACTMSSPWVHRWIHEADRSEDPMANVTLRAMVALIVGTASVGRV